MGLESWLAILVVAEIIEKLLASVGETSIVRVLVELVGKKFHLVDNMIGVVAVTITEDPLTDAPPVGVLIETVGGLLSTVRVTPIDVV